MLEDLDDRLALQADRGVALPPFRCLRNAAVGRHAPVGQVGVVGNGQVVATVRLGAGGIQSRPKLAVDGRFKIGDRQVRHLGVAEDDVAVVVGGAWSARVLIADETGEGALLTAVVGGLGGLHYPPPRLGRRLRAESAVLPAQGFDAHWRLHVDGLGEQHHALLLIHSIAGAELRVVAGGAGRAAQRPLTEELAMVRDRQEIQGPVDAELPGRLAVLVQRPKGDGLPLGEAVRILRGGAGGVGGGVKGIAGVDMHIAEQRLAQRLVVQARRPLLGVAHQALAGLRIRNG